MNKFDALKQFQSWPREWQELCGEYWAECDYPLVLPSESDSFPFDQPKAAPKMAVQPIIPRKTYKCHTWSEAESEFILQLINEETKLNSIVSRFVERYPKRSVHAVRRRVWGIRTGEIPQEVKY
jgi:hypothetical protein